MHIRININIVILTISGFMQINAILKDDLFTSLAINTAFFLILISEIVNSQKLNQNSVTIPIYELQQLHRFAQLGELTSGVIHDISNPLTTVSLSLQNLKNRHKSPQIQRALTGTKTMESYVKAVRSQISEGRTNEAFKVRAVIDNVVQITAYKAQQLKVNIQVDCPVDLLLSGSPIRLQQALSNLISNAIDAYRSSQKIKRTIEVKVKNQKTKLLFTVQDYGTGISTNNQKVIFDPFFTTKIIHQGTGIGLAITKNIIENEFNGAIKVKSAVGRGSLFTLELPKNAGKIPKQRFSIPSINSSHALGAVKFSRKSLG